MTTTFLDHITLTAPTLEAGAALVRNALGVTPQTGGEHPRMGTHNLLLRLGPALFLEVIAPNPTAPAPPRPRWFALDRLQPDSPPALSTWVVRTTDMPASVAAATEALGRVEPMSRGALNWLITIPEDGSVALDGAGPALIQWQAAAHPASGLEDRGLVLENFEIFHPEPDRVTRLLGALKLDAPVSVRPTPTGESARLVAHIRTPLGLRVLGA
jgi:hypothetical protein